MSLDAQNHLNVLRILLLMDWSCVRVFIVQSQVVNENLEFWKHVVGESCVSEI